MRLLRPFVLGLSLLGSYAVAQEVDQEALKDSRQGYQSDVARLRKIVINSLYSHREVFLRELISNANDAIEKLRLTSLTNKEVWDGVSPLNITIKAVKDEEGNGGRLVITDTGIGMTPDELRANLGTLAKSGTTEFLQKAEDSTDTSGSGNLIGAFGLGFYSSFLVADKVYVASVPPPSAQNPNPEQYVFASSSDENEFAVYPDPRGKTLERGTEITLVMKDDALEYLENQEIIQLINKHSGFSSNFPIYVYQTKEEEVPIEEDEEEAVPPVEETTAEKKEETETAEEKDEDEAVVEEEDEEKEDVEDAEKPKKTKKIVVDDWRYVNSAPPLWTRDPKDNITSIEYELFYQATWRDFAAKPISYQHFSGDAGSSVSFKSIIYIPGSLPDTFWTSPLQAVSRDIRLMVKRVFITSDLGDEGIPKWASWVRAVVDADDLPLNVSRETLQSNKFLKQVKNIIVKRIISLFTKLSEEEPAKWEKVQEVYGNVLKLGAVEDTKNRDKLVPLTRFKTNIRNDTSLDQYLENKKEGQKQIFYVADMGKTADQLMKSVFIEKLNARGYEVFLCTEPLDEILFQNLRRYKGIPFQDVAKAGLKFGDEDQAELDERAHMTIDKHKYEPLINYLKEQVKDIVRTVVISDRLVTSPCAIVADASGMTANVQRMMSASNNRQAGNQAYEQAKRYKVLEINPRSPLIQGLLRRVEQLPGEDEERDIEAEDELREVTSILIDGALVRSGFEVADSDEFMIRVDRVLRRSLGVDENAPTDKTVKPAPPVDPELKDESFYDPPMDFSDPIFDGPGVVLPDDLKDKVSIEMEEIDEEGNVIPPKSKKHDEL